MQSPFGLESIEAFAARFYAGKSLLITPYGYTTTFAALAQGATQTNTVNIAANADFMLLGLRHFATGPEVAPIEVATKSVPSVRVLITDSGSNEQFTNAAVALENYSTNGDPYKDLEYPRIISGRSVLTVQATSYESLDVTWNIDLFLHGVLIRAYSGS